MFKLFPNDALGRETKTVSIEGQRLVQIIDAQGNDRNMWFHGGTFPFLLLLCGDHGFPEADVVRQKPKVGQRVCPGGNLLDSDSIPPKGVSSEVHCLSRNLTLCSSRNTLSGIMHCLTKNLTLHSSTNTASGII